MSAGPNRYRISSVLQLEFFRGVSSQKEVKNNPRPRHDYYNLAVIDWRTRHWCPAFGKPKNAYRVDRNRTKAFYVIILCWAVIIFEYLLRKIYTIFDNLVRETPLPPILTFSVASPCFFFHKPHLTRYFWRKTTTISLEILFRQFFTTFFFFFSYKLRYIVLKLREGFFFLPKFPAL